MALSNVLPWKRDQNSTNTGPNPENRDSHPRQPTVHTLTHKKSSVLTHSKSSTQVITILESQTETVN